MEQYCSNGVKYERNRLQKLHDCKIREEVERIFKEKMYCYKHKME